MNAPATRTSTGPMRDWAQVRADFPILERTVNGKPLVYFDNANTAQKPQAVIEAVDDFYRRHNANVSRAVHALGTEATEAYEGSRATLARLLNVPADEVEKEREIVTEISRNEGKPEAALPKIVEGRVNAFFKQVALLDQDYAKDNKLSVAKVAGDAGITITDFARFKVGA